MSEKLEKDVDNMLHSRRLAGRISGLASGSLAGLDFGRKLSFDICPWNAVCRMVLSLGGGVVGGVVGFIAGDAIGNALEK